MVVAKCVKCGKEYELKSDEEPSNFQCECGGDLKSKKIVSKSLKTKKSKDKPDIKNEWNKQSKNKKIGIAGACCIGLILVVVVGGMIFSNNTTSGNSANSNGVFENQFVKFNKPSDLTIEDHSTATHLDIIFDPSTTAGEMTTETLAPEDLSSDYPDSLPSISGNIVSGYNEAGDIGSHITLQTLPGGSFGISTNFNDKYQSDYQEIINSLVIKKNPTE